MNLKPRATKRFKLKPRTKRIVRLMSRTATPLPGLTPREIEVVYWHAQGKRISDIMEILDLKLDAIRQHNFRIKNKLGAQTMSGCVALAIRKGIIQ